MTSEKHTHNMIMLQQNVKRMQTLSAIQSQSQLDTSSSSTAGAGAGPEAAMADMAYQQALFIQMMTGGQLPAGASQEQQLALLAAAAAAGSSPWSQQHQQQQQQQQQQLVAAAAAASGGGAADAGLNPETMEPPPEPMEPNPQSVFQCLVCSIFCSDAAEHVAQHVAADRSRLREHEALLLIGGHYLCRLCAYKTTLKANFQLHCKTDKHLQRLQHATHIQEGGPRNDWKLQYVTSTTNPVQLRCNVCDYYTNSVHKLQVHAAGARHQLAVELFRFLSDEQQQQTSQHCQYQCRLCQMDCPNKAALLQHARSLRHCQMEQLAEMQRRSKPETAAIPLELRDLFAVIPGAATDSDNDDDEDDREPTDRNMASGKHWCITPFLNYQLSAIRVQHNVQCPYLPNSSACLPSRELM
jgi:AT-binding transcription factor 1